MNIAYTSTSTTAITYHITRFGKLPNEHDDVHQYITDTINYRRRELGMSRAELARKSCISYMTIYRIEKGKWNLIKYMPKIYRALGMQFNLTFGILQQQTKKEGK